MTGPLLTTSRLALSSCRATDAEWLHALWTDPDVRRYLWDGVVIPLERTAAAIEASRADFEARGHGLWVLTQRDTGVRVGFAGLRTAAWEPTPEIVYGLDPRQWGHGFAVEAAAAVLAHAFTVLTLPRVVAATNPPNVRSIRVLERLGMRLERTGDLDGCETRFYAVDRDGFHNRSLHSETDRAGYPRGVEQPGSSSGS